MNTKFCVIDTVITIILLLMGIWLIYESISMMYIYKYTNQPDSYRMDETTLISNLVNGNLLIITSLLFCWKKEVGALFFQFAGIMFIFYAINLNVIDMIFYHDFSIDLLFVIIPCVILVVGGIAIYTYFRRKILVYRNTKIVGIQVVLSIVIYFYIDFIFLNQHLLLIE